jgi:tetratricopeptide (TPR) repeat protein
VNAQTTCLVACDGETPAQYVAGTLADTDVQRFEIHLLGCSPCQRAVRDAATVAAGGRRMRSSGRLRLGLIALPLAAAVLLFVLVPREDAWQRLGRIDAPLFEGLPVRAAPDSAALFAEQAIDRYQGGHYREAAALFETALALDSSAALSFYLGVSRLLADDPRAALAPLRAAAAHRVYGPEAHLYLAKLWIREAMPESALVHARRAAESSEPIAAHAAALADSIRLLEP